jgi:lipopolysaccharide exporter
LYILNKINQSQFAKNLAILLSGTMLAQLIGVIAYPILSRLYNPEDFGVMAAIMAISSVIIPIASLRYENAIVIEKDDNLVVKLQSLCFSILLSISIVIYLLILFFPSLFFWIKEPTSLNGYIFFAVPIIFFIGLINILHSRLNRESMYKLLGTVHIVRKLGIIFFQLIFAFFGFAALGLILGNLIGVFIAILVILYFGNDIFRHLSIGKSYQKEVAIRYLDFPKFSAPQSIVNAVMAQMPIIVFGFSYGIEAVGLLYFATKIVQLPITFMGQSVRTVFFKYASVHRDDVPRLLKSLTKITNYLIAIIITPVVLLFFFGPELFAIIFGDEWRQAGTFSGWLIIWFGANLVQSPSRALFVVFEKQQELLWLDICLGIFRMVVLVISIIYYDAIIAIAMYSIISFIFFSFTIVGWRIYLKRRL